MPDELETNPKRSTTPALIYAITTLGVLGSLPSFLLWTTELAYKVGQWYLNFLLIYPLAIWLSLIGIWKMKKWGVLAYTSTVVAAEIILLKHNVLWSYSSLIIPVIVTSTAWFYFKKMT